MLLSFAFLNFPHFVNSQTRYGLQHDQDFMNHQHLIQRKFQASFRYNCTLKHLSQSQPQIRNAEQKLNLVTEKKNGNNVGLMVRLVAEKNTVKNFPIFLFQRFPPISRKPNRARKTISVEKVLTGGSFGRPPQVSTFSLIDTFLEEKGRVTPHPLECSIRFQSKKLILSKEKIGFS